MNIGQFVQQFNDQTREMAGTTIPVVISVYNDRSFEFILKSPPAAVLLKKAAGFLSNNANSSDTLINICRKLERLSKSEAFSLLLEHQNAVIEILLFGNLDITCRGFFIRRFSGFCAPAE